MRGGVRAVEALSLSRTRWWCVFGVNGIVSSVSSHVQVKQLNDEVMLLNNVRRKQDEERAGINGQ